MSALPATTPPAQPAVWTVPPECIPDVTDIVISDGAPVDGLITEKQMRLLTEPLYSSWRGPAEGRPFAVLANVGLFHAPRQPPIVPDVMLSLDVTWPEDLHEKKHNSYFAWVIGKMPDVAVEIVSNHEGGEDTHKLQMYERLRITYYVIYDPEQYLQAEVLRVFQWTGTRYHSLAAEWLEIVGLGLRLWEGKFEGMQGTWLRWADHAGQVIPTGAEGRELERQRADAQQQRAEKEQQRADAEQQRAEKEQQQAQKEQQRAEAERQRAEAAFREIHRLRQMLRQSGTEPGAADSP